MKYFRITLALLILPFAAACNAAQDTGANKIQWYAGYTMPQFLADPVEINTQADIAGLLDQAWYAPFRVHATGSNQAITLKTCSDYFNAPQHPLWTVKESENAAFMQIVVMCEATRAIANAAPANMNSNSLPVFDHTLPAKLPKQMAMIISSTESTRILADKAIAHMSQVDTPVKFSGQSAHEMTYVYKSGEQQLQLVASGDFNHDGIEDYLISSQDSVKGGSYTALRLFLVTRLQGQADYTLLKQFAGN
ncbi:MAG: hypothetical protein GC149_01415 [Gammaproteobacteria bacterium]|nr:hypothetical protein [Gammaproteobacteria bacterium]